MFDINSQVTRCTAASNLKASEHMVRNRLKSQKHARPPVFAHVNRSSSPQRGQKKLMPQV